jgi:hypothetical protein
VNRLAGAEDVCVCDFIGTLGGTWVHYRLVPDAVADLALALGSGGAEAAAA